MCGIVVFWNASRVSNSQATHDVQKALEIIRSRGPDSLSVECIVNLVFGFARLQINGLGQGGHQPIHDFDHPHWIVVCNGEIFNVTTLLQEFQITLPSGSSDCYILPYLFERLGVEAACRRLDGDFAFVAWNMVENKVYAARDLFGVRPLFFGVQRDEHGVAKLAWTSEAKALCSTMSPWANTWDHIKEIEPGTVFSVQLSTGQICAKQRYASIQPFLKVPFLTDSTLAHQAIQKAFVLAVSKRLQCLERPVVASCSGGVDSSLVCAVGKKILGRLTTVSIGDDPNAPDLIASRLAAKHIGSDHHEFIVTKEECFSAIPTVIFTIESADVTSVRASVFHYLLFKKIREKMPDVAVVFGGDGSDEVFGSYLYNYNAPSDAEFEDESARRLNEIGKYDVRRPDRCAAAFGFEVRVPFLDREFVATALSVSTALRRPVRDRQMEKQVLRDAFRQTNLLPDEILYRQKEAFSDGVSTLENSWFASVKQYAEQFGGEEQWYQSILKSYFPLYSSVLVPEKWLPKWCGDIQEPSARVLMEYR